MPFVGPHASHADVPIAVQFAENSREDTTAFPSDIEMSRQSLEQERKIDSESNIRG